MATIEQGESALDQLTKDPKRIDYNLELFLALNEEYREKPLYPRPPKTDSASREIRAKKRLRDLDTRFKLTGKKIMEVGTGRGHLLASLRGAYECEAHGVDVYEPDSWAKDVPGLHYHCVDLTDPEAEFPEKDFDFMFSFSVWEHIVHPYAMLKRCFDLLRPGGTIYVSANLFRGAMASHRYRDVFFPYPHILFEDEVFRQFYQHIGRNPARAVWVNRLSAADYLLYFDELGYETLDINYAERQLDEEFYNRFHDTLSRYPIRDLKREFIQAHLKKPE